MPAVWRYRTGHRLVHRRCHRPTASECSRGRVRAAATPTVHRADRARRVYLSHLGAVLPGDVAVLQHLVQPVDSSIGVRAELDTLWRSAGIVVPGEGTVALQSGRRYDAYVETGATAASRLVVVQVSVIHVDSGQEVAVTRVMEPQRSEYLRRAGRELSPTVSFRVPASGSYSVRVSTQQTVPDAHVSRWVHRLDSSAVPTCRYRAGSRLRHLCFPCSS